LASIGSWSARHPWRVLGAWAVLGAGLLGASLAWGQPPGPNITVPGAPSEAAARRLAERFPEQGAGRGIAVFRTPTGRLDDPAAQEAVAATLGRIEEIGHVQGVIAPSGPAASLLQSTDGRTAYAPILFDVGALDVPEHTVEEIVAAGAPARRAGLEVGFGGPSFERVRPEAARTGELVGILAAVVVLALAFGSVGAVALPLALAAIAVPLGLAGTRLLAAVTEVNSVAPAMATMIGLAVGVDYALFVVARHRQDLRAGAEPVAAASRAVDTSGRSVLFAGATVIVSMLAVWSIGMPVITSMGVAVSFTVAVAVLAALTALPALLGLLGTRIDAWRVPFVRLRAESDPEAPPPWSTRWATWVTRRPWRSLAMGTVALVALAAPFLSLHTGWPDARHRTEDDPARVAFDLMTEGFGIGANGPLFVTVETGDTDQVTAVHTWLAGMEGVRSVSPPIPNAGADTWVVQVIPRSGPESADTAELVGRLRDLDGLDATGAGIDVTGATAFYVDLDDHLSARLPWFVAAVIGLSVLLLTAVFRAPIVALKAAAMNVLGIAAAYGVVVAVFQWGWGGALVGIARPVPIFSSLPLVMFAVLFGLSMDYEVFILSRIRESWSSGRDNTAAVVEGLGASSRVVTAAAVIMFAVFAGFASATAIEVKMTGFGLAVAVLLDATVIRQVLVPASMTLLGERNWWIPRWLERRLPAIDLEGSASAASARPASARPASARPASARPAPSTVRT
jgi:RND superfamily putative drug exporter